jgi:hypothetical protein
LLGEGRRAVIVCVGSRKESGPCRACRALGRACREVHGRRRAGVFSAGPRRTRTRPSGRQGRARGSGRGGEAERRRTGARLPPREIATGLVVVGDLIGEGAARGAGGRRREAEPGGSSSGIGWAGRGGHGVPRVGRHELRDRRRALRRRREDGERTAIDGKFTPPRDVSPRASAAAVGGAFTTRP